MNPELGSFWRTIRMEADKSPCQRFDWRRGQMHSWRCYECVLLRWLNSFVKYFCLFYRFSRLVSLSMLLWQMFAIRRQIYVECCVMWTWAVVRQETRYGARMVRELLFTMVCVHCLSLLTDDPNFGGTVNDFVSISQRKQWSTKGVDSLVHKHSLYLYCNREVVMEESMLVHFHVSWSFLSDCKIIL